MSDEGAQQGASKHGKTQQGKMSGEGGQQEVSKPSKTQQGQRMMLTVATPKSARVQLQSRKKQLSQQLPSQPRRQQHGRKQRAGGSSC